VPTRVELRDYEPELPTRRDQSTALATIVAVFYALVLGQVLVQEPHLFLDPAQHRTAAWAMAVVFAGAAWEFLTYSFNMGRFPYKVRWITKSNTASEELRFAFDLLVAASYGLLLIQAYGTYARPAESLKWFFAVLVLIDVLSLVSVLLCAVQWNVGLYRVVAELPFTIALLVVYVHWHPVTASVNHNFLIVTLGYVFARELSIRLMAKHRFATRNAKEVWLAKMRRRRLERDEAGAAAPGAGLKVYVAGPLGFVPYGSTFNETTLMARLQQAGYTTHNPWDVPEPAATVLARARTVDRAQLAEANRLAGAHNTELIDDSDAVVAVLDGMDVDSGTAAEIGYAAGKTPPVPVIGLRLDQRPAGDNLGATVNLQVEYFVALSKGSIVEAQSGSPADVETALDQVLQALAKAVPTNAGAGAPA
jgi:nucleoside 2-deoxyribosyltransferase